MKKTTPPPASFKWDLAVFFVFAGLVALFYRQVLFGDSTFVFVDASRFFYPMWKWGAGVWGQGIIPLWNPDAQFGTPYLADPQTACAYPPLVLLYLFFSATWAFSLLIILHHLWALCGFWFLARGQGFSGKSSFLGALIFGFSLHLICSSWTPVALMTISWIPWVFWAGEKVFQEGKRGFLWLSLAWAMQLAAGYPVLTYLTGLAVGLHFTWKSWWQALPLRPDFMGKAHGKGGKASGDSAKLRANAHRSLGVGGPIGKGLFNVLGSRKVAVVSLRWLVPFGLAVLVAAAYNLAWGLSFVELFRLSNYEQGANHFQDLHWRDLATALAPFYRGHPLEANYHGPHYWVATYFIGLPALCLMAWGAFSFIYRKTSWGLLPVLLVLSCGGLGVAEALRAIVPGYTLVIHSGYWISLLALWAALLSTETLDVFTAPNPARRRSLSWMVICLLVYGVSIGLQAPSLLPFALSLLLLLSTVFFNAPLVRWGLVVLSLVLSLGPAASSINILLNKSYYDEKPKIMALLPKEGRLFFSPALMERSRVLEGSAMAQAYENAKQSLYPNWPLAFGREEAPFYNTLQLRSSAAWTLQKPYLYSANQPRKQLDFLGVRYLFGKSSLTNLKPITNPGGQVELYENPSAFPKWYSVQKASSCQTDVVLFLRDKAGTMDYAKECQVEDDSKVGSYQTRQVTFSNANPDQVIIKAVGTGKALIVSSETGYPGWKARVDSKEKPVETINCSFRGVVLGEGETQAVLSYEPASFRLGLFACLLVFGFWLGLFLKSLYSKK